MKTFNLSLMIAAAAFIAGTTSCSETELDTPNRDGQVTFNLSLQPKSTRAAGGTFGLGINATALKCLVYDGSGKYLTQTSSTLTNGQGSVNLKLVGNGNYKLLFWADAGEAASPYTLSNDGEISVNLDKMQPCSELNDAFYAVREFTGGSTDVDTVTLTRPFAQINLGTDDSATEGMTETYPSGVYTTVTTSLYTKMNLFDKTVSDKQTYTGKINPVASMAAESFPVAHKQEGKQYDYAYMLYAIVPEEGFTSDVTMKTYNTPTATSPVWTLKAPNAPLKQNWRTNIFGSLYTSRTDFNVIIDNHFLGEENIDKAPIVVDNLFDFNVAIDKANEVPNTHILVNGDIALYANQYIPLTGKNTVIEIAEGKTLSMEPQEGQTVIHPKYIFIVNKGTKVTFTGKGTFKDKGRLIENFGTLTINGCNFISEGTQEPLIKNSGFLYINGGNMKADGSCIENVKDTQQMRVEISSGTFFSSNAYCYDCKSSDIRTFIYNGLFRSYYGAVKTSGYFEIYNGNFIVQKSDKVSNPQYPLYITNVGPDDNAGIYFGNFYSAEGNTTAICTDNPACDIFLQGGYFSAASDKENVTPCTGYKFAPANEPALPGTNPLTRKVVRNSY